MIKYKVSKIPEMSLQKKRQEIHEIHNNISVIKEGGEGAQGQKERKEVRLDCSKERKEKVT